MANRKPGTAGDGDTTGKRPAAAKQAPGGKSAAGAGGAAAASGGAGTTPERQPPRNAGRAAAKSAPAKGAGTTGAAAKKTGPAAKKAAAPAKSTGAARKSGSAAGTAKGAGGKADLRGDLRRFVDENPDGWGHDQWQGLLHNLGQRGHDTSDADRIGAELERERVSSRLEGVEGVSSKHAKSLTERFGSLHGLRSAAVEEIEGAAKLPREVAERIKQRLG